jgi:tetratricopeptide (TPR) repeat protein
MEDFYAILDRVALLNSGTRLELVEEGGALVEEVNLVCRTAIAKALSELGDHSQPFKSLDDPVRQREQGEALWRRLEGCTAEERKLLVEVGREYRTWALCERLGFESTLKAAKDCRESLELASLSLQVAEMAEDSGDWNDSLRGYSWAHIGNAWRVCGDLSKAENAFRISAGLWKRERYGFLNPGQITSLRASLLKHKGQYAKALELLDAALHADASEEWQFRILLKKAFTLEQLGDSEGALLVLRESENVLPRINEKRLVFGHGFNLAVVLCHLGRIEEAKMLLPKIRALANGENRLDEVRLMWLDGRIDLASGLRKAAESKLRSVQRFFCDSGVLFDTALVSLELGVLFLEEGRMDEVRLLVRELEPVLQSQRVDAELMGLLRIFIESVRGDIFTIKLAEQLTASIKRRGLVYS